jgi:hypothetical protein
MDSLRQGMYHREATFVNARALSLFFQSFSYQIVFFESDILSSGTRVNTAHLAMSLFS